VKMTSDSEDDFGEEDEEADVSRTSGCCGFFCCLQYTVLLFGTVLLVLYFWPTPNWPIQQAIRSAELGTLKELIKDAKQQHGYTSLDQIDCGSGKSMLSYAAQYNHPKLMEYLIREGSDVHKQKDHDGRTPMHLAAAYGGAEAIRVLVKHGADVNFKAKWGWTPLHVALFWDNEPVITELLQVDKLDIDSFVEDGLNPIQLALSYTSPTVCFQLLDKGAELSPHEQMYDVYMEFRDRNTRMKKAMEIERMENLDRAGDLWDHTQLRQEI